VKRHFFELDPAERFDLLGDASRALNRPGVVLEKDLWVCWALEALFSDPSPNGAGVGSRSDPQQRMVFKGGTSLSKIYGAIHRFSEDLDITIDYREAHDPIADPFSSEVSNTQRRAFSERMRVFTAETKSLNLD
jgi:Nucleotidyl transferase AbiEii toxin, Type IV TA system